MTPARAKLTRIREQLNRIFVEREALIEGALAALLSASHVLIIGPPGTAKSMLADELCRRIEGANYFQWLLTKFSTPEEIFGAVSLRGLEQDDYRRVTAHKLPEAHIAFLDEIFKANSSILNALLTLINERVFHNGRERVRVPLITLFGASNELPDEDELTALYDRFLLRYVVDYIAEEHHFLRMLDATPPGGRTTLTFEELHALQEEARAVRVPDAIRDAIARLRRELGAEQIVASDRRWKNCLELLRARAYLADRDAVSDGDLSFLGAALWKDPEERPKVTEAIRRIVKGYEDEAQALLYETQELRDYAERGWESDELRMRAATEAHAKIANILMKFDDLLRAAQENGRDTSHAERMREQVREIQQSMLRRL